MNAIRNLKKNVNCKMKTKTKQNLKSKSSYSNMFHISIFFILNLFHSENEKLSQREVVWQQMESLAKTKNDWLKNAGNFK